MFTEYLNLLTYAVDNNLIPDPDNEDWGAVINFAIDNATSNSALYLPFRAHAYTIQTTINIHRPILLKGAGGQLPRGCILKFKNNGLPTGVAITSKNVVIEGIYFTNQFSNEGRVQVAISIEESKVRIENCGFFFFEQIGIHILPNANSWYLKNINISGHGTAGYLQSAVLAEGNMGFGSNINILAMEGSGIVDSSIEGNTYIGCHSNETGKGEDSTNGVYVMERGLMLGSYAEDNQKPLEIGEDAQLWNGHTGLPLNGLQNEQDIGTILQPRYSIASFAFPTGSNGLRFENHFDIPVFLTYGGKEDLTFFEFVALDDIVLQEMGEKPTYPEYLDTYEDLLKTPHKRWRLGFDIEGKVYKWYFNSLEDAGMVFSSEKNFRNMEWRHIGFLGYYLPKNRSAIFVGAASNPISSLGLGSLIYNSDPEINQGGTPTNKNYASWLTVSGSGGIEVIGVDLLQS